MWLMTAMKNWRLLLLWSVIDDGDWYCRNLITPNMTEFEFLRSYDGVVDQGVVWRSSKPTAIAYFLEDDKVKPGLLYLPSDCTSVKVKPESATCP